MTLREGWIITFDDDFVRHIFPNWNEAARAVVASGNAYMSEQGMIIDERYNIELVTVH